MPDIAKQYRDRLDALTVRERVARSIAMFHWSREMIGRQILREHGPLDYERLKWEVALRQYGADAGMRSVIGGMLARVSN